MGIMKKSKLSPPPQKRRPPIKKPTKVNKLERPKRTVTASYDTGPNRRDVGKRTFPAKKGKAKTKKSMFGMDKGAPRDVSPAGGGSPKDQATIPDMRRGMQIPTRMKGGKGVMSYNDLVKKKTGGRV